MKLIHLNTLIILLLTSCNTTVKIPPPPPPPVVDSYFPCSEEVFYWALCMAESKCNDKAVFMEPAPLNYESLGRFQLSPEDHRGYPECSPNREDYFIAEKNTECAYAIVKKLRAKYPNESYQKSLGRYWSVLRGPEWGDKARSGFNRFKSYALQKGCVIK
jgi:hypothetical protein